VTTSEPSAPGSSPVPHSLARLGELRKLIAAGLLMLAGPVDLDELDRWMRIGWERGRRADIPYGAGILRNVTRGLDLVFGFDSTLIEPPDETPPLVRVHWPLRPTTAAANHYPAVAAAIVRTHHR
jgi:hypothetical protein